MISLAQIGALEIHAWGSRADKLDQPDRLIFDLDPDPQVPWDFVIRSARKIRAFLQELGLESFVKTTGGKGLHLVVPVDRRHDWVEAKSFCKQVADLIEKADPQQYTVNISKAARRGKIFIDYLRNGRGATAVVPYSTRARAVCAYFDSFVLGRVEQSHALRSLFSPNSEHASRIVEERSLEGYCVRPPEPDRPNSKGGASSCLTA